MAKTNNSAGKKAVLGAGLATLAAAAGAAGYFFYGSKNAKKHRAGASAWAKNLKVDVVKNAKKIKKLDEKAYRTLVENSVQAYKQVKSIDQADLAHAASELKANWHAISREVGRVAGKESKVVKSAAKKAVKAVKKVVTKKKTAKKKA